MTDKIEVTLGDGTKVMAEPTKASIHCYECLRLITLPPSDDLDRCCFNTVLEAPDYAFTFEEEEG